MTSDGHPVRAEVASIVSSFEALVALLAEAERRGDFDGDALVRLANAKSFAERGITLSKQLAVKIETSRTSD
jgi:hypothetical protein